MLEELRKGELVVELPGRAGGGGTVMRYVISNKGKAELERKRGEVGKEVRKQLQILAYYCGLAGDRALAASITELSTRM